MSLLKLITDEYNNWVIDPINYLDSEMYQNGYDPNFPPMQIIGELLEEKDIPHNIQINDDGRIPINQIPDINLDCSNKIALIGMEPHKSRPENIYGTFQQQYRFLYSLENNDAIIVDGNINPFRQNINFQNYLKWQLQYFSNYNLIVANNVISRHWAKIWNLAIGLINGPSVDFTPDLNNHLHYTGFNENKLNWLSEKIVAIDVLPMHAANNVRRFLFNGIDLLLDKISLLNINHAVVIGYGAFGVIINELNEPEVNILNIGGWNIRYCEIIFNDRKLNIYGVPSQGFGTYKNFYELGQFLSNNLN